MKSRETRERFALYKGKRYRLLWRGETKYGERAHLQFLDQSKDFWVSASEIREVKAREKRSANRPYVCDECGELVYPGTRCWETGLLH